MTDSRYFPRPAARRWAIVLASVCCLVASPPAMSQDPTETASQRFAHFLTEAWEFELRESPLLATNVGDARYNDRLPRESLADHQRRAEVKRGWQQRLAQIDRAALNRDERLNYDIFRHQLRDELTEYEHRGHLQPITNRSGFHVQFPELYREVPLKTRGDYENYLARLRAFPQYVADHIALMREGIRLGYVLPAIVLDGADEVITPHLVDDPNDSLLFKPFLQFPATLPQAERAKLVQAGQEAVRERVLPGFAAFRTFLRDEYVPAARASIAAAQLPGGREFYRHRVRKFTTLDLTPEQVHETGLAEVKRIRAEMEAIVQKVKFEGDFAAFLQCLRTSPRFYPRTPDDLQKEVALILKRMDGELPRLFRTLPRTPYGLRVIPDYIAPKTTSAYYQPPAADGSRGGYYYINTYDLKSRPLYEMEALSLHEAVPGHHLQLALQQELTGLPPFRRFTDFTAYIEGWALYAERLGLEVGFYQDPYSDFGRLTFEMWRACRLVVDTGLHYLGWTRQQAIDFMTAHTALAEHNIRAEVDRYIAWPGQALGYKIGELKIRELRRQAETALGDRFDLREFHDVVLRSGSVPLPLLETQVREYIDERKRGAESGRASAR